ncbi:MAG: caspase family protein [Microcoleaceae cyanobacterium]
MSQLKRRHFLQFAGSTLAAMGLSQLDFFHRAEQYGRVLAQSTPRKLALLVGINEYQGATKLRGCAMDVELQKQLLIHRFGFNPQDILIVSDESKLQPTRENILQAFEEHLIKQAKPGDVAVFHYSGHGGLVKDPSPLDLTVCRQETGQVNSCQYNGTIVPINAEPVKQEGETLAVSDIMGQTLFLLMSRVPTDNLTTILDSCHSGAGTRGNVVVRSARLSRSDGQLVPSEDEFVVQAKLLSELGWSDATFKQKRQQGIAKGVALGSAGRTEEAIDAKFDDFYAGGFTYLLTRYLWQLTSEQSAQSIYVNLQRSTRSLAEAKNHRTSQIPTFEFQPGTSFDQQPLFFTNLPTPSAEAVITKVSGEQIQFWMGGVASQNLALDKGNVFSVLDESGKIVGEIEQTSRVPGSLSGIGKQIAGDASAIQVDRLLREKIVGFPANPKLQIALDESLGAERAAAEAGLKSQKWVEVVPKNQLSTSGYFLGRFTEAYKQEQTGRGLDIKLLPPTSSVGLFQSDLTPNKSSFGDLQETVARATARLQPTFKRLLANQILGRLLDVGRGSPLQVRAKVSGGGKSLQVASRGVASSKAVVDPLRVAARTELKITVENLEDQELYLGVLVIGATGNITILFPADWDAPEEASRIDKKGNGNDGQLTVPRPDEGRFEVQGTSGAPELLLLVSKEPLRLALKAMQNIARGRGLSRGPIGGLGDDEPTELITGLLGDLTELTRSSRQADGDIVSVPPGSKASMDTSTMAVLSAVIEVVA